MGDMYPDSDIRLVNNDKVTLLLDGSIPGLVLYPENEASAELVDSIKDTLSAREFYVKCYNQNDCDFSRLSRLISENPLLVVILDGLNPNIVFAYGYFKANGRSIFPVFNANDLKKSKGDQTLFDLDEYVSFDLSGTSPGEISSGLRSVLEQYLDENLETIVSNYAELILNEGQAEGPLSEELRSLLFSILDMHTGKAEPGADILNDVCTRISDLEKNQGIVFPGKAYSILPYIYLSLFQKGDLTTLELKKGIKNIENISRKHYVTESDDIDLLLLRKRVADSHTLLSVYDKRVENCRISIDRLEKLLDDLATEDISLYRAKTLNNLGVNYLLMEDCTGEREYLDKSVYYFRSALEGIDKSRFSLEFARITMNLGISFYRKAFYNSENQLFADALNTFRNCYETFTPELFPQEHYESRILEGNTLRELSLRNDDTETLGKSLELHDAALSFFTSDTYPLDHARLLTEKARSYMIYFTITRNADYYLKSWECYRSALKIYNLADYPVNYALTIAAIGELFLTYAKLTGSDLSGEAIPLLEEALTLIRFEDSPPVYGSIQVVLGDSYSYSGSVLRDEESFLRAVESYEQALRFYTDSTYAALYSEINKKSARAYKSLSALNPDSTYTESAISCYQKSLETGSPESRPLLYFTVYKETGDVYSIILENSDNADDDIIREITSCYENALEVLNRDELRNEYTERKYNIANSYMDIGKRVGSVELLNTAVDKFTELNDIFTNVEKTEKNGAINRGLGEAFLALYEINDSAEMLEKSINCFFESLEFYIPENFPEEFAGINERLGNCYTAKSFIDNDTERLRDAISCFESSLEYFSDPEARCSLLRKIGDLYSHISGHVFDRESIVNSIDYYRKALQTVTNDDYKPNHGHIFNNLGSQLRLLAEVENKTDNCNSAIDCFLKAVNISGEQGGTVYASLLNNLGAVYITLAEARCTAENTGKAIEYLNSALDETDREISPELFSFISNNLGNAYQLLSSCRSIDMQKVLDYYGRSLHFLNPQNTPLEYVIVMNNLSQARCSTASGTERFSGQEAVFNICEELLKKLESLNNKRYIPFVKYNTANAYYAIADEECPEEYCERALMYIDEISPDIDTVSQYLDSVVDNFKGAVYIKLSGRKAGDENIKSAVEHLERATSYYCGNGDLNFCAITRANYVLAMSLFDRQCGEQVESHRTMSLYNCAAGYYTESEFPTEYGSIRYNLGRLLLRSGSVDNDINKIRESLGCLNECLNVLEKESDPVYPATVLYTLASAHSELAEHKDTRENRELAIKYIGECKKLVNLPARSFLYSLCCMKEGEILESVFRDSGDYQGCFQGLRSYREALANIYDREYSGLGDTIREKIFGIFSILSEEDRDADNTGVTIERLLEIRDIFSWNEFPDEYLAINKMIAERYRDLAVTTDTQRNLTAAMDIYRELVTIAEKANKYEELSYGYREIGNCQRMLGELTNDTEILEKAVTSYEHSLNYNKQPYDRENTRTVYSLIATCQECMCRIFRDRKEFGNALRCLDRAISVYGEFDDQYSQNKLSYQKAMLLKLRADENRDADAYIEAANILRTLLSLNGNENHSFRSTEIYEELGDIYSSAAELKGAPELLELTAENYMKALQISSTAGSSEKTFELNRKTGEIHRAIGDIGYEAGEYEQALTHYRNAVKYLDKQLYPEIYTEIQQKIVESYKKLGAHMVGNDTGSAINLYESALEISRNSGDRDKTAEIYRVLARMYLELGESDNNPEQLKLAIKYYTEGLDVYDQDDHPQQRAEINLGIANCFRLLAQMEEKEHNLKKNIDYLNNALLYYTQESDPEQYGKINESVVSAYEELGEICHANSDSDVSREYFTKALKYYEEKGDKEKTAYIKNRINEILKSTYVIEELEDPETVIGKLESLSEIYRSEGDTDRYRDIMIQLGDTLLETGGLQHGDDSLSRACEIYSQLADDSNIDTSSEYYACIMRKKGLACRLLSKEDNRELLSESYKANTESLSVYIQNHIEEYRNTLLDEIEQEILLILDADLRCLTFAGATAGYWKNISLLDPLPVTERITGIHVAASEIAVKNAGDSNCKDVVTFLEQLRDRIRSSETDQEENVVAGKLYETYMNAASFCFNSSEYLDSVQFYTNAGSLISSCENTGNELEVQYGLGCSYRSLWEQERNDSYLKKSIRNFEKCSEIVNSEDAGKAEEIENILFQLKTEYADILISDGDYENARSVIDELLEIYDKNGCEDKHYSLLRTKADLHFIDTVKSGDESGISENIELYAYALDYYTKDDFPEVYDEISGKLAELNRMKGDGGDTVQDGESTGNNSFVTENEVADRREPSLPPGEIDENTDYTELVNRYEDILQNINAEDSPAQFAVTCVKLGRCFLQIAKNSGDQKDYEASIKAFQNAIDVYGSDEYQDKSAEIAREIGNVYKSLALNTNDPKFFGLMTDSYKQALKYYNYEDFPEINAVLLKEIAHAETHTAELTGDIGRYRESADKFRQALSFFNRDDHPQEFADISRNLGISCSIIYELEPDRDILESSIDAFCNAIDFYIAENDIANIASVSNYLGTAYSALAGISNNPTEYLRKSAEHYKRSADICLDQGNVGEYGFISRSLAAVYAKLAELEDTVVNLKNAINSYEESLEYYTCNDTPEEYASINNHLGTLYKKLSEFEDAAGNCSESVKCFEKVLNVYSNDEFPMEYAATLNNLGIAYRALAEVEHKAENCKRSVESYLKVLQVYTLKDFPVQYSSTQNNLGSAYRTLAEEEDKKENCRKAIKAYEEALKVRKIQTMPAQFAATQNNLGVSYRALAEVEDKEKNCMQAIKAYESALIVYTIDKYPVQYATTKVNIAGAYSTLAEVKERGKNCDLSIECYREAQRVFNIDDFEDVYEMIEESIDDLASFREYAG